MMQIMISLAYSQTITETFGIGINRFSIEFVQIGNPGNIADTQGYPNPSGSVSYIYNIGKYEISRDIITKASNIGNLTIDLEDMTPYGGNEPNRPATGISWNEAARFVNWLNISKGFSPSYKFLTTSTSENLSLWNPSEAGYDPQNPFRNKGARYFLPSSDEWYKAAFFNPTLNSYNKFPMRDGSTPAAVTSGNTGAVYNNSTGPADITNAGGLSNYGTMAQAGNVFEIIEAAYDGINSDGSEARLWRGGAWFSPQLWTGSNIAYFEGTNANYFGTGLRIAMIPEPSALSLLAFGFGALTMMRRRRS